MTVVAHPLAPVVALTLATTVALCALVSGGGEAPAAGELVLRYGWGLMLLLWMDADARKRRRLPCYDFGLLAGLLFPLSLVWYCFWSRGWRGALVLLLLAALWMIPYVLATALWVVLSIRA